MNYVKNDAFKNIIVNDYLLSTDTIIEAINHCNLALSNLNNLNGEMNISILEILGMRNLSGVVGEYFAKSVQLKSNENLQSNLHQDGYPDLLLTNTVDKTKYYHTLYNEANGKKYPKDKILFSPFKYGGIEVKATCGSTPSASIAPKPLLGEQRIQLLNKFDWKAHHRETNNLLAILWDFVNGIPTIVACFYSNSLTIDDWGRIVQPSSSGGRTTSVSIMNSKGIKKMCQGWIAILNDPIYLEKLSNNKFIGSELTSYINQDHH